MNQHSSNEVALTTEATASNVSNGKRLAKMAGAAVLSLGLVGTFALPAYAAESVNVDPQNIDSWNDQSLVTAGGSDQASALHTVSGTEDAELLAKEKAEEEAKAAEEAAAAAAAQGGDAAADATPAAADVPPGAGGAGMVAAAKAQLGQMQDCTALVERSLRAIGVPAGDLGTQVGEYTALGGQIVSSPAPGDVLVWSGRHVAVYIGNGQAVHGGYGGNQTVIAGAYIDGPPSAIVRF